MSSPQTNPKSRTPLLAGVALSAVVLAGVYVAYMKGAFRSAPEMPPEISAPSFPETSPMVAQPMPMPTQPAPMHPDAIGAGHDPLMSEVAGTMVAPTPSNALPAPEAGLSTELVNLMELRRKSELGRARVETLRVDLEISQAEEMLHGAATGANQLPELVGLSGKAPHLTAEFLVGNRIVQAKQGDWLSRDWQITEVLSSGVRMTRRGGTDSRVILFGDTPIDALPPASGGAPMVTLQPPYVGERR